MYKSECSLSCSILSYPHVSSFLRYIFPKHGVFDHLKIMFSVDTRDHASQSHKLTARIIILHDLIFTALESRQDAVFKIIIIKKTNIHNLCTLSWTPFLCISLSPKDLTLLHIYKWSVTTHNSGLHSGL